ncbi:MAG: class I SAM-dependent methyltransferase [Marmoricola sp.]
MSEQMTPGDRTSHGRSFASVADAYDRARPSYPAEAVSWMVGAHRDGPVKVLELGAGTGLLTELLVAAGHDVVASDPLPEMLEHLTNRLPDVRTLVASAESIPLESDAVDVVVCAQSFHWFDHPVALLEIARVLRPGGVLALVWNVRDEGIPWVRKLGTIIGNDANRDDLADPARNSEYFGFVDSREYRFWQNLRKDELLDLVRSRSGVAVLTEPERAALLDRVSALYDDYGRGPDGMKMPYVTRCFRTLVSDVPLPEPEPGEIEVLDDREPDPATDAPDVPFDVDATQPIARREPPSGPPEDPGTTLIDFK